MNDETTGLPEHAEEVEARRERTDAKARRGARNLRWGILLGVLALSTVVGLLHQYPTTWFRTAPVDAFCPFGGIESLWATLSSGFYLKRVAASSFILLVGTLGVATLYGRAFCGQFCPLGALQELFARLGRRFAGRRLEMPAVLDRPARYLKYVVLALIAYFSWRAGELVIRPYDPWAAYHHITSAELFTSFGIGAAVLGVTVVGSLGYDRFFCKYACPMGALLGLVNKVSFFKVRRDAGTCIDCGACDKACPVNLEVATADTVASAECLACGECVSACPAAGALEFTDRGRTRKTSARGVTLATLGIMAGIVFVTTLSGSFAWTKGSGGGGGHEQEAAAAPTGAAAFNVYAIRGYNTISEVSQATGIPLAEMQADFGGVSDTDAIRPLNDITEIYGFGLDDVRGYVGMRLGLDAQTGEAAEGG